MKKKTFFVTLIFLFFAAFVGSGFLSKPKESQEVPSNGPPQWAAGLLPADAEYSYLNVKEIRKDKGGDAVFRILNMPSYIEAEVDFPIGQQNWFLLYLEKDVPTAEVLRDVGQFEIFRSLFVGMGIDREAIKLKEAEIAGASFVIEEFPVEEEDEDEEEYQADPVCLSLAGKISDRVVLYTMLARKSEAKSIVEMLRQKKKVPFEVAHQKELAIAGNAPFVKIWTFGDFIITIGTKRSPPRLKLFLKELRTGIKKQELAQLCKSGLQEMQNAFADTLLGEPTARLQIFLKEPQEVHQKRELTRLYESGLRRLQKVLGDAVANALPAISEKALVESLQHSLACAQLSSQQGYFCFSIPIGRELKSEISRKLIAYEKMSRDQRWDFWNDRDADIAILSNSVKNAIFGDEELIRFGKSLFCIATRLQEKQVDSLFTPRRNIAHAEYRDAVIPPSGTLLFRMLANNKTQIPGEQQIIEDALMLPLDENELFAVKETEGKVLRAKWYYISNARRDVNDAEPGESCFFYENFLPSFSPKVYRPYSHDAWEKWEALSSEEREEAGYVIAQPFYLGKFSQGGRSYLRVVPNPENKDETILQVLCMEPPAELDVQGEDLKNCDVEKRNGVSIVTFDLIYPTGSDKLRNLTTKYQPSSDGAAVYRIGIIFKDYLVFAPSLRAVLVACGQIAGVTPTEAKEIVQFVKSCHQPKVVEPEIISEHSTTSD